MNASAFVVTEEQRYRLAIHETGHYVGLRKALEYFAPPNSDRGDIWGGTLTLVPSGNRGGAYQPLSRPWVDQYTPEGIYMNPDGVRAEIVCAFAGHFAEIEHNPGHAVGRAARFLLGCAASDLEDVRELLTYLLPGERPRLKQITAELVRDHSHADQADCG